MFYRLFLSDACLGKACYEKCRFKYDKSSADIRIGDAWGSHYKNNEEGVSAAIALTEKGNELLWRCNCELETLPFDVVAEGQMRIAAKYLWYFYVIQKFLRMRRVDITQIFIIRKILMKFHNRLNKLGKISGMKSMNTGIK